MVLRIMPTTTYIFEDLILVLRLVHRSIDFYLKIIVKL
jgi:hypothetical protein